MQEDNEKGSPVTPTGPAAAKDVPAEATSSETLSEIEESEKVSSEKGGAGSSPALSPDGSFDSDQSGRSPKDDPGPM